jgi:phenylacetate-coenzyme A ligase PaaK-like adenylate-forming protein
MSATAAKPSDAPTAEQIQKAREQLDAQVREVARWHFSPETGTPFWLEKAKTYKFDPLKDVQTFDDLKLFGTFEDDWLRGGPVRRWVPKAYANKPVYVFETGGTTGLPKSRVVIDDFRIDYEMMSATLPDQYFPKGSNWLMLGPSGPRRLRLAIEHLAQYRGGICFCVDLDPRWVVKLIKQRKLDEANAYKEHCIDQALTILAGGHDVKCMFTTPKLLAALDAALREGKLEDKMRQLGQKVPAGGVRSIRDTGITGIFSGGTEFTPQFTREAWEEMLDEGAVYMTPTYGNTLMGLACSKPIGPHDGFKITYYAPQPRAAIQVVDPKNYDRVVGYGETGRVLLTTLTKEFFVPRFPERDEGEREPPYVKYPWDGVSGVRPFSELAATTVVGVY